MKIEVSEYSELYITEKFQLFTDAIGWRMNGARPEYAIVIDESGVSWTLHRQLAPMLIATAIQKLKLAVGPPNDEDELWSVYYGRLGIVTENIVLGIAIFDCVAMIQFVKEGRWKNV